VEVVLVAIVALLELDIGVLCAHRNNNREDFVIA